MRLMGRRVVEDAPQIPGAERGARRPLVRDAEVRGMQLAAAPARQVFAGPVVARGDRRPRCPAIRERRRELEASCSLPIEHDAGVEIELARRLGAVVPGRHAQPDRRCGLRAAVEHGVAAGVEGVERPMER